MRYRWLRQLDSIFNIGGAEAGFLVDGASTFFFERAQDSTARGIGNSVEETIDIGHGVVGRDMSHDSEG